MSTVTTQKTSQDVAIEIENLATHKAKLTARAGQLLESISTTYSAKESAERASLMQQIEGITIAELRLSEEYRQAVISEELAALEVEARAASEHRDMLPGIEAEIAKVELKLSMLKQEHQEHLAIWQFFCHTVQSKGLTAKADANGLVQWVNIINRYRVHSVDMNLPGGWGRE